VLGISYDAPRKTVRFAPRLGGLTWVEGVAPLACGDVRARVEATASGARASITTPAGVALEVDGGIRPPTRLPGGSHTLTLSR
jgi:hypothetical protein